MKLRILAIIIAVALAFTLGWYVRAQQGPHYQSVKADPASIMGISARVDALESRMQTAETRLNAMRDNMLWLTGQEEYRLDELTAYFTALPSRTVVPCWTGNVTREDWLTQAAQVSSVIDGIKADLAW